MCRAFRTNQTAITIGKASMSAIETWGEMVRVEHAQSDHMRGVRPADTWTESAAIQSRSIPDGAMRWSRDPIAPYPGETLLDVGAGGGRLALPLL